MQNQTIDKNQKKYVFLIVAILLSFISLFDNNVYLRGLILLAAFISWFRFIKAMVKTRKNEGRMGSDLDF